MQAVKSGGARRQHAAADADRADVGLSARLSRISDYDPIADFKPVTQLAHLRFRRRGRAAGAGEVAQGAGRLGQGQSDAGQLRHAGRRLAAALPRRAVRRARPASICEQVTYRGSAAALTDLIGGQIPIVFTTTSDLLEMHKAGRIRVLATSDAQRSPFLPDVPTFKEAGYDLQAHRLVRRCSRRRRRRRT